MRLSRAVLALALLACALVAQAAAPPTAQEIIKKEGRLMFSDGSSWYAFERDGRFSSGPLGMSGRTITGTWKHDGSLFVVEGTWSWLNGLSRPGDRRRMKLGISHPRPAAAPPRQPLMGGKPGRFHDCYFVVDELVPVKAR